MLEMVLWNNDGQQEKMQNNQVGDSAETHGKMMVDHGSEDGKKGIWETIMG